MRRRSKAIEESPIPAPQPVPKKRRKPRAAAEPVAVNGQVETDGEDLEAGVQIPRAEDAQATEWFDPPDIPRGFLTVVTAPPSAGKSTYLAYLATKAKHPLILHGDDDYHRTVIARLMASGLSLPSARCIGAHESWQFPRELAKLQRYIESHHIDLVTVDPIDEYTDDVFDEDRSGQVRKLLFGLIKVSKETGASVVIVRHPGKDPANLLPGSKAWRSVPRLILQLIPDPDSVGLGIFRHFKNHVGSRPDDRFYTLQGLDDSPKRWQFGSSVDPAIARLATEVPDRLERTKLKDARALVLGVLADEQWHSCRQLYSIAKDHQISDQTIRRALEAERAEKRTQGQGADYTCEYRLPRSRTAQG